jgi:DNA-directed RNA polymerase subunit RPC12/RpoP
MLAHEHRETILDSEAPPQTRPKARLYCQECGRDAPLSDWERRRTTTGTAVVCPDCGHRLTVRRE